jgi:hypothetical protein
MYAGAASPLLMISYGNGKKIGISPEDLDDFMVTLNASK